MRDSILRWLTGSHGVHAETLMVVIGALAGFTAQNAAFRSIGAGHAVERRDLCGRGRRPTLLFGDRINGYLA